MKKILFVFFAVTVVVQTSAQNARLDVIATSGEFFSNSSNSLSWTPGECITETFSNSGNKLTQCFQQGIYGVNTFVDYTENLITIKLFPNPTADFVNLEIQLQDKKGYFYQLFDIEGNCLKNGKITS